MIAVNSFKDVDSDMEVALKLIYHIDNPCGIVVNGDRINIRDFYLNEAKRILPLLSNSFARELLEEKIRIYN